jgi:hypothetical protein
MDNSGPANLIHVMLSSHGTYCLHHNGYYQTRLKPPISGTFSDLGRFFRSWAKLDGLGREEKALLPMLRSRPGNPPPLLIKKFFGRVTLGFWGTFVVPSDLTDDTTFRAFLGVA